MPSTANVASPRYVNPRIAAKNPMSHASATIRMRLMDFVEDRGSLADGASGSLMHLHRSKPRGAFALDTDEEEARWMECGKRLSGRISVCVAWVKTGC
jgi:hypothetical protein